MSPRHSFRITLAAAALATLGMAAASAAPATVAARPIAQLSEADALWMPNTTTVPALRAATLPPASLTSSAYLFSSILDGKPVRWNPCQPIHWQSNTASGPVGGLTVLAAAVAHIAAVTGTTWVYDGASTAIPNTAYLPTTPTNVNKPVLIGWTDGRSSDLLAGQPAQVLGMTRTVWFGVDNGSGHPVAATRGAVIALDRTDQIPLRGARSWSATALHELGHVMGLAHPSNQSELMAATLPATTSTYQPGDLIGLSYLGRQAGCVVVPAL